MENHDIIVLRNNILYTSKQNFKSIFKNLQVFQIPLLQIL